MNNKRRNLLQQAVSMLDTASEDISRALDEEQDCLSNMPESLQYSERYEKMESSVSSLESALDDIDNAKQSIDSASE